MTADEWAREQMRHLAANVRELIDLMRSALRIIDARLKAIERRLGIDPAAKPEPDFVGMGP